MLENVKNILGKYLETNYKDSNIQLNGFSFNESMDPNLEEVEAVECTNLHDHKILIYEDESFVSFTLYDRNFINDFCGEGVFTQKENAEEIILRVFDQFLNTEW